MTVKHPAKFSPAVLDAIRRVLDERHFVGHILDPFAGVGGVHALQTIDRATHGIELEPEWADCSFYTQVGDATLLPFDPGSFDAVVTSPPYGNRMADKYVGAPCATTSRRVTYDLALGRPLTDGSMAALQAGPKYVELMKLAVAEMYRVLRPGGLLVLNLSNHIRKGVIVPVCDWWLTVCKRAGFGLEAECAVATPRMRGGANADARVECEYVFVMVKP